MGKIPEPEQGLYGRYEIRFKAKILRVNNEGCQKMKGKSETKSNRKRSWGGEEVSRESGCQREHQLSMFEGRRLYGLR